MNRISGRWGVGGRLRICSSQHTGGFLFPHTGGCLYPFTFVLGAKHKIKYGCYGEKNIWAYAGGSPISGTFYCIPPCASFIQILKIDQLSTQSNSNKLRKSDKIIGLFHYPNPLQQGTIRALPDDLGI